MESDRGWMINAYDVASATGSWHIVTKGGGFALGQLRKGARQPGEADGHGKMVYAVLGVRDNGEKRTAGTWAEVTAAAAKRGVTGPWRMLKGGYGPGDWFPQGAVDKVLAVKLRWHNSDNEKSGKPGSLIKFTDPGAPCTVKIISSDGWGGSHRCGRPAVRTIAPSDVGRGHGLDTDGDGGEMRLCKLHAGHADRRAAAAEARAIEREKEDAEERRHDENVARCHEVLGKIRPLLSEMGVHPQTLVVGGGHEYEDRDRVGILLPAETAELLTGMAVELEELRSSLELS